MAPGNQPDSLLAGTQIAGRYELVRVVGSGGMGQVFAARRLALDDLVAIKCVHEARLDEQSRARFLREARAMARIRHPNVVQVFDFGDPNDGPPYLVMELLDGPSLSALMREHGRLPLARALSIFADLCAAVEAGHRRGVVHRDLKPGNVVLSRDDDGGETLKVLDFGLARFVGEAAGDDDLQTQAGVLMGTSAYMSPEQIESGEAGPASDVFALGVMLYEMATGQLPFRGPTAVATIMRITMGEFTPPEVLVPDLPKRVSELIASALSREPSKRPSSPRELADALNLARPDTTWRGASLASPQREDATAPRATQTHFGSIAKRTPGALRTHTQTQTQPPVVYPSGPAEAARPLHGRRAEHDALLDALRSCSQGSRPQVSLVTGAAGMGKSALAEHYRARAESRGAKVLRARFYAYEGDRPPPNETFLWMLNEADASDVAADAGDKVGGQPARAGSEAADADSIADTGGDKWRAFERIAARFLAHAQGETGPQGEAGAPKPLVLIFDDLQWATRLELEGIGFLLRSFDQRPLHLVLTARGEAVRSDAQSEASQWLAKLARQNPGALGRVPLLPLKKDALRRWLERTYPNLRAQPSQFRRVHQATGGNPHYFNELLRHLEARGALRRDGAAWLLDAPPELEMPESVAQAVLANLAVLSEQARRVAEIASVVGEELRFETLQRACELSEDALEQILESSEMSAVLTERNTSSGADYRFVSPTVRGVLYDAMSRRRRRRAHSSVVAALESLYAGDSKRIAKILCYHFDAIGDAARTLETGLLAAESTLGQFDADNAELALRRVERAMDKLHQGGEAETQTLSPEYEARALAMRGTLSVRLGRYTQAQENLALAQAANERQPQSDTQRTARAEILLTLADCQLGRGELEAAAQTSRGAVELATKIEGATALRCEAILKEAGVNARLGRYELAHEALEELLAMPAAAGVGRLQARAHREQAWIFTRRGDLERAQTHALESMRLAKQHRDPYARYLATSVQAIVMAQRGEGAAAIELYESALRMARGLSLRRREMIELANSAMAYLQIGNDDEALRRMLQTRALCAELQDRASEGDSWVGLGRVLVARGELDEAQTALGRGRELCEATGRREYAALATLEMGFVELERADPQSAITLLERAQDTFEASESVYLWRVYQGLARAMIADPSRRDLAEDYANRALVRLEELLAEHQAGAKATHERDQLCAAQASLHELLQQTRA